jgi:hypothetical protein
VAGDGGFLVEEFIHAITSQLDRVQDALRVKAVNRPLTYALRDLTLELKVFVDMDARGQVRFRASGPNESGASVVHLGFTTITRPMIEENTVSLSTTRSADLGELGLAPEEQQRLERMGVRNLAQLRTLQATTGVSTVARLSDVPIDRLRDVLTRGRPTLNGVVPERPAPTPPDAGVRPAPTPRPGASVPPPPPPPGRPGLPGVRPGSLPKTPLAPADTPVIRLAPGTRRVQLLGANLLEPDAEPTITLNDTPLRITEMDADRIVVEMPPAAPAGTLAVVLPGGESLAYELWFDDGVREAAAEEAWAPEDGQ